MSHPSWVCGLKHVNYNVLGQVSSVTPFVGVWIETCLSRTWPKNVEVTPFVGVWIETAKLVRNQLWGEVTPFVGVWIETISKMHGWSVAYVTPFVGVWIETANFCPCCYWPRCHTLRGCVDWNRYTETRVFRIRSHTLRGCVDWNIGGDDKTLSINRHTLRGCVDWNNKMSGLLISWWKSHPSWVCGLKL